MWLITSLLATGSAKAFANDLTMIDLPVSHFSIESGSRSSQSGYFNYSRTGMSFLSDFLQRAVNWFALVLKHSPKLMLSVCGVSVGRAIFFEPVQLLTNLDLPMPGIFIDVVAFAGEDQQFMRDAQSL